MPANRAPIRYFDQKDPTRRDALNALNDTLWLLAEALPLALEAIGGKTIAVQEQFWQSFTDFDRHQGLLMGARIDRPGDIRDELIGWVEIVDLRAGGKRGPIS